MRGEIKGSDRNIRNFAKLQASNLRIKLGTGLANLGGATWEQLGTGQQFVEFTKLSGLDSKGQIGANWCRATIPGNFLQKTPKKEGLFSE